MPSQVLDLTEEEQALILSSREHKEEEKKLKPFGKFIVLMGSHFEALDQKVHGKGSGAFWASSDLVKRFGDDKFRRVALKRGEEDLSSNPDQVFSSGEDEEEIVVLENPALANTPDTYDTMTLNELRKFATEMEIDVGNAKTKEQIISKLREGSA